MSRYLLAALEQTQSRRDAALAQSLHAQEEASRARHQEKQLQDYRADYQQRAPAQAGNHTRMEIIGCHHGFMQRLDHAVGQQSTRREQLERIATTQREALLSLELHAAAITRLLQRRRAETRQREQRVEQRQTDDWVLTRTPTNQGTRA